MSADQDFGHTPASANGRSDGGLPPAFPERAGTVLALASSGCFDHFLERFLAWAGRLLRLPWWAVNFLIHAVTALAVCLYGDVHRHFGPNGVLAISGMLIAEFAFSTWMLRELRATRPLALAVAACIPEGTVRLAWLRRYLGPTHWGWVLPIGGRKGRSEPRGLFLPVWLPAALLVALYYGHFLAYGHFGSWANFFQFYWSNALLVATMTIKAAMLVAVLGRFWLLAGLTRIANNHLTSDLSPMQRIALHADCRRRSVELSVVLGVVTGLWVLAQGVAFGWSYWSSLLSFWLAALFAIQTVLLRGVRLGPSTAIMALLQLVVSAIPLSPGTPTMYRRAEVWAALAACAFPAAPPLLAGLFGGILPG